ncbi:MAG: nuclear transport factor 2 family protein [Phormidesmis sp.]
MNNVEIVRCVYKAFSEGDMETVSRLLSPSVEWIESDGIPYGGVFKGYAAVVEGVFAKIGAEWTDFTAHVDEFIDAGDVVVTLGTDSGTYKATGKRMSASAASIWTVKDGKVVKFRQYIDTLAIAIATRLL